MSIRQSVRGRSRTAALMLLPAILLAACVPAARSTEPQAAPPGGEYTLEGTEWVLASLDGDSPVEGPAITLGFFPDDYLEGDAGCNRYGADYSATGDDFHFSQIHRTNLECDVPDRVMQQEQALFEALASVAGYRATDDRLEFDDAAGETILVFARKLPPAIDPALKDSEWVLVSLHGRDLVEDSRITLNFTAEGIKGYAGCNDYGGEYEAADEGALTTPDIWCTAMDCGMQALMDQEQAYLQALSQAAAYRVMDGRLEIDSAAGEMILVFARHEEFPTDPSDLLGTVWQLASIDGTSPIAGSTLTLAFHDQYRLSGHAGCRDYVATYQASGDDMNLLFEAMIDAGCPMHDPLLEQEAQFLGILAQSHLRLGEGQLEVFGERGGILVFESLAEDSIASLESTPWMLTAFVEEKVVEDMPAPLLMPRDRLAEVEITLTLRDGTANGSAGCNAYHAAYATAGLSISFENPATTAMACADPAGIMAQEHRYLGLLEAATMYHIYGRHLWLETGDGRALVFTAW